MNRSRFCSRAVAAAITTALMSTSFAYADPAQAPNQVPVPAEAQQPAAPAEAQPAVDALPDLDKIQSMDELMKVMDKASADVSAKNEEVKQLQLDIESKEQSVREAGDAVQKAQTRADDARRAEAEAKQAVDKLAQAKYRGLQVDPLTAIVNSDGPQNAIDRSAYMSAYARKAQEALAKQQAATAEAGQAHSEAARLQAEQNFQMADLQFKRAEVEKQETQLKSNIEKIQKRVDGLSAEEKAKWEQKNGPVEYSLAGVTGTNADGMKALEAAMTKLGSPYGWGATGPTEFDCSGLVVWSYAQQGKTVPRTSQAQMAGGTPVSRADLQPGDVVGYYPGATHVGIYAGNGKLVHASDYGIPVQVVDVDSMPFYGARRY